MMMFSKMAVLASVMVATAVGSLDHAMAHGSDVVASFDGGIGVNPVAGGAGAANVDGTLPNVRTNVVRGVNPSGFPWQIAGLRAEVGADGRIKVKGRGLLLAGGNGIGTTAGQRVFATVVCEAAAPFVERNTSTTVALELNGDFRIDDTLSPAPVECASPVLLIRNAAGAWFAAGIPVFEGE